METQISMSHNGPEAGLRMTPAFMNGTTQPGGLDAPTLTANADNSHREAAIRSSYRSYDEADVILLHRAQRGDKAALGDLIWRQYPKLRSLAYRMLGPNASADDVVLTAFLRAVSNVGTFEVRGSFGAWMHRIVVNECILVLRHQAKYGPIQFDEPTHSQLSAAGNPFADPEEEIANRELSALVALNLRRIPRILRDPLLLRLEGYSCLEISKRLGITTAAAKSRTFRARQMLRQRMVHHLPRRMVGPSSGDDSPPSQEWTSKDVQHQSLRGRQSHT